jgi:hypothetical protein
MITGGPAMQPTTHSSNQIIPASIFCSAYVSEHHLDEIHSYWKPAAQRIDFEVVLNALRSALLLRK